MASPPSRTSALAVVPTVGQCQLSRSASPEPRASGIPAVPAHGPCQPNDVALPPSNSTAIRGAALLEGLDFDGPTRQLERVVEETHLTLVRNGLLPPDGGRGDRADDTSMQSSSAAAFGCDSFADSPAIPSLDAVDRALEELQVGLAEIDNTLGRPGGVGACSVPAGRPVDRALEELQVSLAEIDNTLGRPGGVGACSVPAGRPVSLYPHGSASAV